MRKKKFWLFCLLTLFSINLMAQTKSNYIVKLNFNFPSSSLETVVNSRVGKGIEVEYQKAFFFDIPLSINIGFNRWNTGKSNFSGWESSKINNVNIGVRAVLKQEKGKLKGLYSAVGFRLDRWRVEKDYNFYKSTLKGTFDIEFGFVTKNGFLFSIRPYKVNLDRQIKAKFLEFSIGKRF